MFCSVLIRPELMSTNDSKSTASETDVFPCVAESSDLTRAKSGRGVAGGSDGYQFPKTDFRHWEKKLFRHNYLEDGKRVTAKTYSVRIAYRGRRHSLALGLSNLRESAKKARDVHAMLLAQGWEATLAQYKPDYSPPQPAGAVPTVGSYIAAAAKVSAVRERSFHGYCVSLRRIVAGVKKLGGDKKKGNKKYGPGTGGSAKWRQAIESTPLADLTAEAVQAWKLAYVAQAGNDPAAQRRAKNTFNSTMRQARSLFSRKILSFIGGKLLMPDPLPLSGVAMWERGSTRYMSKVDPAAIISAAAAELGTDPANVEAWKIFLLALCCGLRKKEIDSLTWRQVDFRTGVIQIIETPYFQPKAQDSVGEVDMDPELATVLQGYKARAAGEFVIESPLDPKGPGNQARYRAAPHFERLNEWLRKKGITARKPLHELRKEAGSLVAMHKGLFAAQSFLRHASPQTTAAFYLAKKERLSTGLGSLISAAVPPANVTPMKAPSPPAKSRRNRTKGTA